MNGISFKYCPICGGDLEIGKMQIPSDRTIYLTEYVWWYSDKNKKNSQSYFPKNLFSNKYDKRTAVRKIPCIPAGYCEKCDRIFAEFEIRDWNNPIDEETIQTYDMNYYEESADSIYDDKIVSYDDSEEKYDTIDGYTILTDNIKFKKSED